MNIRPYQNKDRQPWDDYVMSHPDGTVFHLTQWKQVVEEAFGHPSFYLLAENGKGIIGILPMFQIKSRLFGNFMVSVPFAELGGPLADSPFVLDRLLEQAQSLARAQGVDYLEMKNAESVGDYPTKDLYFNFSRELDPDPEVNLAAIPRKQRAMVRKGAKSGLTHETGHHLLPEFYEMMARSYHSLGTPIFAQRFFSKFLDAFGEMSDLLVVRSPEKEPVAGVLTFYYKDRVMPFYAGSRIEARALAPNDYMYWQLMKDGCERGYRVFDYGRSKADTGSFSFKKHWGFEPRQLAYQYMLIKAEEMPNLSPTNPKYRKKIEMWRRMPFGLTKILGPPLAKYLA
jgi:FemAB-related protein (PEP-CTERM system-associated)